RTFDRGVVRYVSAVGTVVDRKWRFLGLYALILILLAVLFWRLPGGFIPGEDQGRVQIQWRLPAGATQARTIEVRDEIEKYLNTYEKANVDFFFLVAGGGGGGGAAGQNTGQGFVNLQHWDDRPGAANTADAIAQRATGAFRNLRDAQVFT